MAPQYEMAGYRIDLLVEGMQGRLAVQCDGDVWHGEGAFDRDARRQRLLERCGIRFIHLRGAALERDPAWALEPVWTELQPEGIWLAGESAEPADADGAARDSGDLAGRRSLDGGAVLNLSIE